MATVRLVQGIWCDLGRHLIPQGEEYKLLPSGLICCPPHEAAVEPGVGKAGSLS